MTVRIAPRSQLRFAELLTAEGVEFWDLPEYPPIPAQPDDTVFEIDELSERRPDLIAYDVYGDPFLWWVIAIANDIKLLPTELRRGLTLRIPSARYVFTVLLR